MAEQALNTDREIWRKGGGDGNGMSYYEPSIHVTQDERVGINVGGMVFVLPVEEWHALAADRYGRERLPTEPDPRLVQRYDETVPGRWEVWLFIGMGLLIVGVLIWALLESYGVLP